MIKMILADDEPVITRGIRKLIDWEQLGIQIIGEYEDGKSALASILRDQPEIALLDISMPGMSGVDIIRECHGLQCRTNIIFISGFQEFEYAKAALEYGAADYLLKPVIREELLKAVEKCIARLEGDRRVTDRASVNYKGHIEFSEETADQNMAYLPLIVYPVFSNKEHEQIRHLIRFSLLSFLEEYFEEHKDGIVFQKENRIVVVLQKNKWKNVSEELERLKEGTENAAGYQMLLICGDEICSMQEIPEMFRKCVEQECYLFFADQMKYSVINIREIPFPGRAEVQDLEIVKKVISDGILGHDREMIREGLDKCKQVVCRLAKGRKEDALFYYCTVMQSLEELLGGKGVRLTFPGNQELLDRGRSCDSFSEMEKLYSDMLCEAYDSLSESVAKNEKKDVNKALEYIEQHYAENLSLNVLANEVHMNPYYFSSFFKKSTGKNFKDYVNQVRLKHAVELLLNTDQKVYEIAMEVGFGDARAFNDAFQKAYGETPTGYRKNLKNF